MSSRLTHAGKKVHTDRHRSNLQGFLCFQKFYHLLSPLLEQPVNEAILREIVWTEEEICIRMKDLEKGSGLKLWKVLVKKVYSSIAGQFISDFNKGAPGNQMMKEMLLDAAKVSLAEPDNREENEVKNNYVDDLVGLITKIIQAEGDNKINLKKFLTYMEMLRLCDAKIGCFDKKLKQLNTLQVLVLSGNLIEDIRFDCLPPSLRVLELHNNLISEIDIRQEIEPRLVYLGLSSNCFTNDSEMEGLPYLDRLCVLDLGDNNISSFSKAAEIIRNCPYLECICLKGNPLSTVVSYKDIIKATSPKLHRLDGISIYYAEENDQTKKIVTKEPFRKGISKKEKVKKAITLPLSNGLCYTAELRIYVFRMVGISKPCSRNRKSKGYFQFEVQLPLLDQRLKVKRKCNAMFQLLKQCGVAPRASQFSISTEEQDGDNVAYKGRKTEMANNAFKSSEKVKKSYNWETEYEEYLENDELVPDATRILSEKLRWAPVIKPNGPIAVVPVHSANLSLLRYTLKSIIVVRLYLNFEGSKEDSDIEKKLMAKISVPAQEPIWNEEYCLYEWSAKQPQIATFYPSTKGPIKGKCRARSSIALSAPTCLLGIGLQRSD